MTTHPARNPEEARKVLEKAGYTKSGDFYARTARPSPLKLTTFGDDATTKGQAQTFIQSMKEIGINFELDSRAQSEFSKVVGNREYDVSISGFGVGSEPTSAAEYFYHSKNWNGVGTPEIDAMIDEMVTILDDAKRAEKCNEIEKKHMSESVSSFPSSMARTSTALPPEARQLRCVPLQELRLVFGWLDGISRSFSSPPPIRFRSVVWGRGAFSFRDSSVP